MLRKIIVVLLITTMILGTTAAVSAGESSDVPEPIWLFKFDEAGESGYSLEYGAVLEDGALKLPGGTYREAGYATLQRGAIMDIADQMTISTWAYLSSGVNYNQYIFSFTNTDDWPGMWCCVTPEGHIVYNFDYRGELVTNSSMFPFNSWVYFTFTVSQYSIHIYLNGKLVAYSDNANNDFYKCSWVKINGAVENTTHFQELDKLSFPFGLIGTSARTAYWDLGGDAAAMFDNYAIYDKKLTANEIKNIYASETVPKATYPIGSPADESQTPAVLKQPLLDLSFDIMEKGCTLVNGAQIEDGVLKLPGGKYRNAGHFVLPRNTLLECLNEVTISSWVYVSSGPGVTQTLFYFSANEGWPGFFSQVDQNGVVEINVDFRGRLLSGTPLPFDKWVHLTITCSKKAVCIYMNGQLVTYYSNSPVITEGGTWEQLNVKNDSTHYPDFVKSAIPLGTLGTASLAYGSEENKVDAAAMYDSLKVYSSALTPGEVTALFNMETAPKAAFPIGAAPLAEAIIAEISGIKVTDAIIDAIVIPEPVVEIEEPSESTETSKETEATKATEPSATTAATTTAKETTTAASTTNKSTDKTTANSESADSGLPAIAIVIGIIVLAAIVIAIAIALSKKNKKSTM